MFKNLYIQVKVDEIEEDQPNNPYTEVVILQQHNDIVRQIIVIDDTRYDTYGG